MHSMHPSQARKPAAISEQTPAESADADDSCPAGGAGYRKPLAGYCKRLFVLPLALLLLFIAFLFVLCKGGDRRSRGGSMSCKWPRVSLFKAYVQRLLRGLWRNPQTKRYAR